MIGLYVLGLFAMWLLLGFAGNAVWKRIADRENKARKMSMSPIGVLLTVLWIGIPFWEVAGKKMYYDAEVNRLCAIDGGIKVYETIKLPPEMFNEYGQINFYRPTQKENALGPEYVLKTNVNYLRDGSPSIRRYDVQVIRRLDSKLLGESIGYGRGGGDIYGPWQPSSFSCPKQYGEVVIERVFIPTNKE